MVSGRVRKRGKVRTVQVRKRPRPQNLVGDELFQPCVCKVDSTAMSVSFSLSNDPSLHPTPSYSASSLDRPSTSSLTNYCARPKAERRVSLGVLESAKFRLSHDVGVPVPSSLSPFFPLLYLTRVARTLFFAVCTSRQVIQLGLFKVESHRKDYREIFYCP